MLKQLSVCVVTCLTSCGILSWSPDLFPTVTVESDRTTTIATTATRRMACVNKKTGQVIAEPPPDAAQSIGAALAPVSRVRVMLERPALKPRR